MNDRLSLGIVGCGEISEQFHLPILQKLTGFDVQWLCDRQLDRAQLLARRFGVPHAYASLDECPGVDCVLLATPVGSRRALLQVAYERGWHAFCEKPFALNAADHQWMLDEARNRRLVLAAGFMRRYYWATRTAAVLVGEVLQHEPLQIIASDCQRMKRSFHGGNWYLSDPKASGGGFLMETGSHLVDQMLSILRAQDVTIERVRQRHDGTVDFETLAEGVVTAPDGRRIPFQFALSRYTDLWSGIAIRAGRSRLELTLSPGSPIVMSVDGGHERTVLPSPEQPTPELIGAYSGQLLEFAARVRAGDFAANPTATGILTTKFIAECYQRCSREHELSTKDEL